MIETKLKNIPRETNKWETELRQAFRSLPQLLKYLKLDPQKSPFPLHDPKKFPLFVPTHYAEKIQKGIWNDPLLLQVLPRGEELNSKKGFENDAVGDQIAQIIPGLLHKYKNRALLIPTSSCAIHCRYCFRKEFPYETMLSDLNLERIIQYLKNHVEINEIILSGGDPLMLSDHSLNNLLQKINTVQNIKTVRIHTRLLTTLPTRVSSNFLNIMSKQNHQKLIFVIHVNHPQELSSIDYSAIEKIQKQNILVLNQSVLLKGINDALEIQKTLTEKLISFGILPYYLHQLDKVSGTHHFEVNTQDGIKIWKKLQKEISGYSLPRYVVEEKGRPSKTLIT